MGEEQIDLVREAYHKREEHPWWSQFADQPRSGYDTRMQRDKDASRKIIAAEPIRYRNRTYSF